MAISALLQSIYEGVNAGIDGKLSLVCEIYEPDTLPTADGFDPADALACFSGTNVETWGGYRGQTYHRVVKKWGDITRSGGTQFNSVSLTFSNDEDSGRLMKALMLAQPLQTFEGYHLVIRIISRDQSVNLDDSDVRFVGKVDKPGDVSRDDFPLSAKEHIGTIDVQVPRRKFSPDDPEGRVKSDPLFEGFPFLPTVGTVTYEARERKRFLGLIPFGSKTVTKTLQYSSHTSLDAGRAVPLVFGRCQMLGIHIGYGDFGNSIAMMTAWADGGRNGIWKYENLRKVSPGFTDIIITSKTPQYRYGLPGGTGAGFQTEILDDAGADKVGNGKYSRTAFTYCFVNGSEVDQDDAAPDLASIIFGCIIPLPNSSGNFTLTGFSDNPAYITRFVLTDPFLMNIDPSFIDDEVCIQTANWCDQYINDYSQADTVQLFNEEGDSAGVDYHLYQSGSVVTPDHFLYQLGEDVNPWLQEVQYQILPEIPPGDPIPDPLPLPDTDNPRFSMRRRYSLNVPVTETQKCIDFLNNVVFPATGLYLTQGANGKIQIRVKKPADFALVRQNTLAGVVEIPVDSVLPWVNSLSGRILIGANLITGEQRKPTGWRYTTAGNSITLAASGPVTASGATFSGGNNTTTPAGATLTFTGHGNCVVTIDGVELAHNAFGTDTTHTQAGWFAAAINAHPTLGRYIKATWDTSTPAVVILTAKIGFLQFTEPLENDHDAAEEVLRIAASFSTSASTSADLPRANVLDNSFKWSIGGQKTGFNVIELSYRDSSQDWRYTTLRVKDEDHIAQVKKEMVKEVNGTGIDNYNQAVRRANQLLAEERDSALEAQHGSDGAALLVEEGSVICVNTSDFPNLPIWVTGSTLKGDLSIHFTGNRYLNSIFSDTAEQRTVPIPTTIKYVDKPPPVAENLEPEEVGAYGADGTWHPRLRGTFDFGEYAGPQVARVFLQRPEDSIFRDTNNLIRPDANNQGLFEIPVAVGPHLVKVVTENKYGNKKASGHPTAAILITGDPPTPVDIPIDDGFTVDPGDAYNFFTWDASPDAGTGVYEVYGRLAGATPEDPMASPTYWTGGTAGILLYRGPDTSFKVDRASPNYAYTGAYVRFVNYSGGVSRWLGPSTALVHLASPTAPEISLDAETTTPLQVALHVTPDTGQDEYNVTQTIVQIRQAGDSWSSFSPGTDSTKVYAGLQKDVSIGWPSGGNVEVRVKYVTTGGDWSNVISHTMAVAGGVVPATYYVEDYSDLTAAVAAIGSSTKARLLCSSATTITANTTITDNIQWEPQPGCLVTAASAYDLTIKGSVISGPYKWVGTNVTIKFVQADNAVNAALGEVFAEWWGAVGYDSVDDTSAFNAALNAIKYSRGIALRLLARPYRASITIPAPTNAAYPVVIRGSGDGSAIRTNSASSPAISLNLGGGEPNTTIIFRDFYLGGRGSQSVPVLSLKAQGGTDNRLFGLLDNIKVVGSGNLSDAVYIKGGLALEVDLRTEEGRYALYLEGSSNTVIKLHAGQNTCNGIMINGGGNLTVLRARVEDSNTPNSRAVSSISGNGSTVTVVTSTAHGMETMDRVTLSGNSGSYNFTGPRSITVVNSTTFTYAGSETGAGTGGTVLISASALRIKNSSFNVINDFANEGKVNLDYTLWMQSDGTTITGEPSCSHNTFVGCTFGGVSNTTRTECSTILLEGACGGNRGYGVTVGRSLPFNSNSWEIRHERNSVGIRPRDNKWYGSAYAGTGSSYNFKFYEEIDGAFGNYCELYERSIERTHIYGNRYKVSDFIVSGEVFIDENSAGQILYSQGATGAFTIRCTFASFVGMRPITVVNNSAYTVSFDPYGTETIDGGSAGVPYDIPAGETVVFGCTVAGNLDLLSSTIEGAAYTDEQAQDAIGAILADSSTIDFTYNDGTPSITADVKSGSITYALMQDVSATDRLLGRSSAGSGDIEEIACTAAGRALIDDVDAATQKATLGIAGFLVTGWSTGPASASTLYYSPGGSFNTGSGTETQRQTVMGACTITELRVHIGGTQPASGTLVFTVHKNGSATSMTVTATAGASNADFSDTTAGHAISVSAGDKISIEAVNNASGTGAAHVTILITYR